MNKKGNVMGLIMFGFLLLVILALGFIVAVGSSIFTWGLSTVVPEVSNLGTADGVNLTQTAELTIVPVNNLVQNASWLTGVLFVIVLIASIGLAMSFRMTGNKWLIGFYFVLMLMIVMGAILISNMYEDFYNGTDEFALELQSYSLLTLMIIQSPLIFTLIGFITGVVIFSGMGEEFV